MFRIVDEGNKLEKNTTKGGPPPSFWLGTDYKYINLLAE